MCYSVPLIATLILNGVIKAKKIENPRLKQLNFLLLGGSVMLVVDHWWNKELFLIGENIVSDLLLGFAMTGAVLVFWWLLGLRKRKQAVVG